MLEGLEKELKAVIKAREALGDKAPTFGRGDGSYRSHDRNDRHDGGFGGRKRRRDDDDDNTSGDSDVPDDVRSIPMPRDTPPPIPKRYLDEWFAKRRAKRNANANSEPLGEGRNAGRGEGRNDPGRGPSTPSTATAPPPPATAAPSKPVEVKTVYEAKPVVRDLQKEAVSAFMPTVVRRKLDKSRGMGGLLEPEEADRLEREGYLKSSVPAADADDENADENDGQDDGRASRASAQAQQPITTGPRAFHATVEDAEDEEG